MTLLPQVFGKDFDKLFVGFDDHWSRMLQLHDEMTKNIPNYPPYNIYKADENKYVIELAVAGFGKQDIEITLDNDKLVVKVRLKMTHKHSCTKGLLLVRSLAASRLMIR
jgi:HSP20 family molecular chaperone IbpA